MTATSMEKAGQIVEQVETMRNSDLIDFTELSAEVHSKLKIQEFKILEEALSNTEFHHKYITMLFRLKRQVNSLQQIERVLYKVLFNYYTDEYPRALRTKDAKDTHIRADHNYLKFETVMQEFKLMVSYLEKVDQLFKERGFSISTASRLIEG